MCQMLVWPIGRPATKIPDWTEGEAQVENQTKYQMHGETGDI